MKSYKLLTLILCFGLLISLLLFFITPQKTKIYQQINQVDEANSTYFIDSSHLIEPLQMTLTALISEGQNSTDADSHQENLDKLAESSAQLSSSLTRIKLNTYTSLNIESDAYSDLVVANHTIDQTYDNFITEAEKLLTLLESFETYFFSTETGDAIAYHEEVLVQLDLMIQTYNHYVEAYNQYETIKKELDHV